VACAFFVLFAASGILAALWIRSRGIAVRGFWMQMSLSVLLAWALAVLWFAAITRLLEANSVVAPRPLVERVLGAYAQAYEIPEDRWPQFAQEFHTVAESQVRRDLVLDHVVESQNLRATEAELDQKVQELAERRGMPAAQLYASLEKAKRLRDVARGITEEKVFAYLLSQSTVETA
jgi:hypothetical protein